MTADNRPPGQAVPQEGAEKPLTLLEIMANHALGEHARIEFQENEAGRYGYLTYMAAEDTMDLFLRVDSRHTLNNMFDALTAQTSAGPHKILADAGLTDWDQMRREVITGVIAYEMKIKSPGVTEEDERRVEVHGEEGIVPLKERNLNAPQESWGVNDPGDEDTEQVLSVEEDADAPTLRERILSVFPDAIISLKIDLKKIDSPSREAANTLGQESADKEGIEVTVWSDRSNFLTFTPGSEKPTSG